MCATKGCFEIVCFEMSLTAVAVRFISLVFSKKSFFLFPQQELTCIHFKAGEVEFAHVELDTDDGKHNNGKEQQQSNLKKGNHGLHNGL